MPLPVAEPPDTKAWAEAELKAASAAPGVKYTEAMPSGV